MRPSHVGRWFTALVLGTGLAGCKGPATPSYPPDPLLVSKRPVEVKPQSAPPTRVALADLVVPPSRADLIAAARQVVRLALRIVQMLERRILAGPGAEVRRGIMKAGRITDEDRLRAMTVFVARMRVSNPDAVDALRRVLFDGVPRRGRRRRARCLRNGDFTIGGAGGR